MACAALLAVSCGGDKKAEIKQMSGFVDGGTSMHVLVAVSYTHLTLPTSCKATW